MGRQSGSGSVHGPYRGAVISPCHDRCRRGGLWVPFPPWASFSSELELAAPAQRREDLMRAWMSQIVIGIIVTVAGTVIANAIMGGGGGRHVWGAGHFSGPMRIGR
jgi:hypothetical protein